MTSSSKVKAAADSTYLVTGAGGMLGRDLQKALAGRDVIAATRSQLDVTDLGAVRAAVAGRDIVINAAAYTNVDAAESNENAAFAINATGAENLALAAAETGATLVHFSTDYVFDGSARAPYSESAPTNPVTAYGRTKQAGEVLALRANPGRTWVIRTAWLYGEHGSNFVATMLRLASQRPAVSVVTDQVGQPTWASDLAEQTVALLDSAAPAGIYHATNSGDGSWFDFAKEIFAVAGIDPERVTPTLSAEFVRPAQRPAYSVLGHDAWTAAGLFPMRDWREALHAAFSSGAFSSGASSSGPVGSPTSGLQ